MKTTVLKRLTHLWHMPVFLTAAHRAGCRLEVLWTAACLLLGGATVFVCLHRKTTAMRQFLLLLITTILFATSAFGQPMTDYGHDCNQGNAVDSKQPRQALSRQT